MGCMNHEFAAQSFEIHVFTQTFSGIHVHVNLICVQNLMEMWQNFFSDHSELSEVDQPMCLDTKRALG